MKKKIVSICLMCCFAFAAIFGLTACGTSGIPALKSNFEKMDALYAANQGVFVEDTYDGISTKVLIDFGEVINQKVDDAEKNYGELRTLYNYSLVIASDYVESNREYILTLEEKKISKNAKKALESVNKAFKQYNNSVTAFVKGRESLIKNFSDDEANNLFILQNFKKVFGKMVSADATLATEVAHLVEETEIFDVIKSTTPTELDTKTVKNYLRAKLLPIFTEFQITEFANNMVWSEQSEGDCKARINDLIEDVKEQFAEYRFNYTVKTSTKALTSKEEMQMLFSLIDDFFLEANSYFKALSGMKFYDLAVKYDNNLKNYLKKNAYAEIYLEKMEQFINVTLPNFSNQVCSMIFAD